MILAQWIPVRSCLLFHVMMWLFHFLCVTCAENRSGQKKKGRRGEEGPFINCSNRVQSHRVDLKHELRSPVSMKVCLGVNFLGWFRSYFHVKASRSLSLTHYPPHSRTFIRRVLVWMRIKRKHWYTWAFFPSWCCTEETDSHVFAPHNVI